MSLAILKNEESEEGVNLNVRIDNLAFLSWLSDEETIRDEGAIAGKIRANPDPTVQLIDKYHDWQYLQFYRKKGVFSVEESEKMLLRLAQITEDIRIVKEENFKLTRDLPLSNGSFLKLFGLSILNLVLAGLLFYLFFLLLMPLSLISIKWIVVYSLIIITLCWLILHFLFPMGIEALKSSFSYWVEKNKSKEKMKHNNLAIELKEREIGSIESKYLYLPTREEWEELKALRKDLFLMEFNLSTSFYTNKK
jgi:hypothetical protein